MRAEEITEMINEVRKGVEDSELGKMVSKNEAGEQQLHHIPVQAFQTILGSLVPRSAVIDSPCATKEA